MKSNRKFFMAAGFLLLTVAGFIAFPSMMRKYSNNLYKVSGKSDDIDFDNLGPDVVKKEVIKGGVRRVT